MGFDGTSHAEERLAATGVLMMQRLVSHAFVTV